MRCLLKGGQVYRDGAFSFSDVLVEAGRIAAVSPDISPERGDRVFDFSSCFLIPGLVDVHVHLRQPGFLYKETIKTGTLAAARGGYTTVCAMPNLNPAPDSPAHLQVQLDAIAADACVEVLPYGCITVGQRGRGELVDFAALAPFVCAFSDDGKGVQDAQLMEHAMRAIAKMGRVLSAHCEDETLLGGGYIHEGDYARRHGHPGICSESETAQVLRDLALAEKTGCRYHVCHVSAKETVAAIRQAKRRGVDVTCETAPHYLLLCDEDLQEDGRFKMNPPLRARADRDALIEGLLDGTIDMIATDHAPHSADEKSRGLAGSLMGVVGLECAFPMLFTSLVQKQKILSLEKLIERMAIAPRSRFGIQGSIHVGARADIAVIDPRIAGQVDPAAFFSLGRATPFAGWEYRGDIRCTIAGGKIAYLKSAEQ